MGATTQLTITRPTVVDGDVRFPGETVDVSPIFARNLLRRGRAVEAGHRITKASPDTPETATAEPAGERAVRPRARKRKAATK